MQHQIETPTISPRSHVAVWRKRSLGEGEGFAEWWWHDQPITCEPEEMDLAELLTLPGIREECILRSNVGFMALHGRSQDRVERLHIIPRDKRGGIDSDVF